MAILKNAVVADETYLHRRFSGQQLHGEWFEDSEQLQKTIAQAREIGDLTAWKLERSKTRHQKFDGLKGFVTGVDPTNNVQYVYTDGAIRLLKSFE